MGEHFIEQQPRQSFPCRVLSGTDLYGARQDRLKKSIFMCDHKKAAKRAILFAVMNSEASVITSDSEGAHCVHPHIHKQPSRCFMYLQGLEP